MIKSEKKSSEETGTEAKVDYMHPEGMPSFGAEQDASSEAEQRKPISKQALQEADGHHMCSASCLGHKTRRHG